MIPMIDTWPKMVVRVEKEKKLDEAIENMAISQSQNQDYAVIQQPEIKFAVVHLMVFLKSE